MSNSPGLLVESNGLNMELLNGVHVGNGQLTLGGDEGDGVGEELAVE